MGIPADAGHDAVAALIKLASDFLATRGHLLRCIFTREDGPGKGPHAQYSMEHPARVGAVIFRALAKMEGSPRPILCRGRQWPGRTGAENALHRGSGLAFRSNPQVFAFHLDMALSYALKGARCHHRRAYAGQERTSRVGP